ncbi:class I SAM-dependent methyltransferase [archaeon]|nr:class I SAM-dependent methyltransferase [archaeon]
MLKKIPNEISSMYNFLDFKDKLYIRLRWRLCPFIEIEKYMPKKGRILDVGCGYGLLSNYLWIKSKDRIIDGIDLSQNRLSIAKKTENKNKKFEIKDVKDLKNISYDGVVMTDFLHHIPYDIQEELIKKIKSNMKKGGILLIQDIAKSNNWKYIFASNLDQFLNLKDKLYYRSIKDFKRVLEKYNFEVEIKMVDKGLPLPDVIYICRH